LSDVSFHHLVTE